MKLARALILWVLALQLLNMSIYSEAYWYCYNGFTKAYDQNGIQSDPTESLVEFLVELKYGQQEAFTYDQHNIDSKNTVKVIFYQIDLEHEKRLIQFLKISTEILYPDHTSNIVSASLQVISPPPDLLVYQC
jgi:hypothetical protein